jgi:hypothetical protein
MKMGWTMTAKKTNKKSAWQYLGYVPTWIVGTQYCDEEAAPGEQLYLEPEPDNPADPLAMAVFSLKGERLGYLPRYDAAVFTPSVNSGSLILKGVAEESANQYKTALRLEAYASPKAGSWFEPMRGDNVLDILHNSVLSVWRDREMYSAATIMAFRDTMRERAHGKTLHIATSVLYRLLRGVGTDKLDTEKAIFRNLVVYPVYGDDVKRKDKGSKADASKLTGQLDFSPESIVKHYACPAHAQGVVICHGSSLHRICWFASVAQMEMRWFNLITDAQKAMPLFSTGKPLSRKNTGEEIAGRLEKAKFEIFAPDVNGKRCLNFGEQFFGQVNIRNDGKLETVDLEVREWLTVDSNLRGKRE